MAVFGGDILLPNLQNNIKKEHYIVIRANLPSFMRISSHQLDFLKSLAGKLTLI